MQLPPPKKRNTAPILGPCLLWPNGWNGWIGQDATWYGGGRPRPRPHCQMGNNLPKGGTAAPPLFGPCLLWPNDHPSQPLGSCTKRSPKTVNQSRCRLGCGLGGAQCTVQILTREGVILRAQRGGPGHDRTCSTINILG